MSGRTSDTPSFSAELCVRIAVLKDKGWAFSVRGGSGQGSWFEGYHRDNSTFVNMWGQAVPGITQACLASVVTLIEQKQAELDRAVRVLENHS